MTWKKRTGLALLAFALCADARPATAQRLVLPAGPLDSAALHAPLQMIDFVYSDDRPKAAQLFAELLTRQADIAPAMVVQLRYLHAVAMSEQDTVVRWYREMARLQGGEYVTALPRILLAIGAYSEALELARRWRPAPGAPARPLREEIEFAVARARGEHDTALEAARALRRAPGQARSYAALGRELAALAKVVPAKNATAAQRAALHALLDSALATTPRGFRVDPVLVFSGYGDALRDAGHDSLASKAWQRALSVLDSTAPRATDRGPLVHDSIRVGRGRLLFALGRFDGARDHLVAPSGRRDDREQFRQAWLGVTLLRLGDAAGARRTEARLAADTTRALRGSTALSRAIIAEALGEPRRGADLIWRHRDAIDLRTLAAQWLLRRTLSDTRVAKWMRGY